MRNYVLKKMLEQFPENADIMLLKGTLPVELDGIALNRNGVKKVCFYSDASKVMLRSIYDFEYKSINDMIIIIRDMITYLKASGFIKIRKGIYAYKDNNKYIVSIKDELKFLKSEEQFKKIIEEVINEAKTDLSKNIDWM